VHVCYASRIELMRIGKECFHTSTLVGSKVQHRALQRLQRCFGDKYRRPEADALILSTANTVNLTCETMHGAAGDVKPVLGV